MNALTGTPVWFATSKKCPTCAAGNVATPVMFGANGLIVYSGSIYQFDPQGNAVHLLDDDGRTVLANLAYDAWGQLMSGSNPTPYGYKGQWGYYTDVETRIQPAAEAAPFQTKPACAGDNPAKAGFRL